MTTLFSTSLHTEEAWTSLRGEGGGVKSLGNGFYMMIYIYHHRVTIYLNHFLNHHNQLAYHFLNHHHQHAYLYDHLDHQLGHPDHHVHQVISMIIIMFIRWLKSSVRAVPLVS